MKNRDMQKELAKEPKAFLLACLRVTTMNQSVHCISIRDQEYAC